MIIHPRDPYTRVDILPTDRKIRVEVEGKVIADCQTGVMSLWETNLPVRWYLPKTTVCERVSSLSFTAFSDRISSSIGNILPSQILRPVAHIKAGQGMSSKVVYCDLVSIVDSHATVIIM